MSKKRLSSRLGLIASTLALLVGGALLPGTIFVVAAQPAPTPVYNLQPDWTATGGGGVWSAYYGPPAYGAVSPGTTALYDGSEAGIIKAGLAVDPTSKIYEDEGLFGFKPTVTINAFAAGTLTYDVRNQAGTNPVWMTIEIDTGLVGEANRSDNTVYQFVPTTNPTGWHTVNAAAGQWQKWTNTVSGIVTGPLMPLSDVATAHTGLNVVRAYLRLGKDDSYHGTGSGTIAWVDKATLGGVTYDFVVTAPTPTPTVVPTATPTTIPSGGDGGGGDGGSSGGGSTNTSPEPAQAPPPPQNAPIAPIENAPIAPIAGNGSNPSPAITGGLPPLVEAPSVGQTSGDVATTSVGTGSNTTVSTNNPSVGVTVPAGGASQPVVASYQSVVQGSAPPPQGGIQMGSTVFQLEFRDPVTHLKVATTAHVTVTYTDADLAATGGSTAGLGLAIFDGTNWVPLPTTVNATTHTVTTTTMIDATFAVVAAPPAGPNARQDYAIDGGGYFAQANGLGGLGGVGYTVTDEDGILFWTEFQKLGGAEVVGYPATQRFSYGGFVTQAFQKMVFQWRPETKTVAFVNVFDELSRTGQDGWLQRSRQTPAAFDTSADTGLTFDKVTARHLAMLEQNQAIQQAFTGTAGWLNRYGLPVSWADYGNVFVVRAQRAVFQQWKVAVPWAAAGDVLVANGGDLGKETGLWPLAGTAPITAPRAAAE